MIKTIEDIKIVLEEKKNKNQQRLGLKRSLEEKLSTIENEQLQLQKDSVKINKAARFVDVAIKSTRRSVISGIETIANESFSAVYENNAPKLEFEVSIKRDRSAIIPYFVKESSNGILVKRTPEGSGCGVSDVASLMLRMVLIKASGSVPILIVDEPFRNLGVKQIPKAARLLKKLSSELGIQVIITTHHETLIDEADKSFYLFLNDKEKVCIKEKENERKQSSKRPV